MIDKLIARLEAATGPDPHLDAEIEAALRGGEPAYRSASRHQFGPSVVLNHGTGNPWDGWESAPSFTGSLDAALTLVPEGWFWRVGRTTLFQAWAGVYRTHPDNGERDRNEFYWHRDHGGPPSTPALALCIAALKALAAGTKPPRPEPGP